jgi:hypothetical protein
MSTYLMISVIAIVVGTLYWGLTSLANTGN